MTSWLERVLFSRRRLVLLAFTCVSLALLGSALTLKIDAGFTKLVPLKRPYMETFLEHRAEFGGADRIVLAVMATDGDMFTPGYFSTLRRATDAMFFLPGVDRTQVFSILTPNVRFIEVVEDGISGGNVLPADFTPDEAGFARVRENIIKAGLVGRLVASDFSGAIVAARLQEFHPGTGERLDYVEVVHELERIRSELLATPGIDVHIIGFAKVVGDIADGASDVALFFAIAFLVTACLVGFHTRSAVLTAALLACSLLAVVWQLGLLGLFGFGIDPMSILVPFLIFAIGVSHGVQVVSAHRDEMSRGATAEEAARTSFRRLVLPGVAALVSDAAGFVAISLIDVQVIQEIAVAAGLGVAAIILTNLGLLPVLLARLRVTARPPRHRPAIWSLFACAARPQPAAVIICAWSVLAVAGAWQATHVRIGDEHEGVPELRPGSTYNRDAAVISDRFSIGVDVLTVIGTTRADGCIDHATMRHLDSFEWTMANVPGVQSVSGLAGTARRLHAAWNEGSLKWHTLPRHQASLVQAVAPVPTTSGLLNADCSIMPVYICTEDHRARTIEHIIHAIDDFNSMNRDGPIVFRLAAGNVGVMAATNEEVATAQFPIVGYVYAAVIAVCLIAFRSIRAVLVIILPLTVVSVLAYALMALLQIGLKISTLAAGVATWIFAQLQFQADMGAILTFMFIVNMAGAVLLLPALGTCFFRTRGSP